MLLYEIYIRSFFDSNDDKIGDFNGINNKLKYLKNLGVEYIWITPFYESPQIDNGYDVSNYLKIDSVYGNDEDFYKLIENAHELGLKIIIDVVFNHTSNQHNWFKMSEFNIGKFSDYYIWSDEPLNSWESMFKGSCWTYSSIRKQFYLHRFAKEQPDLNFTNDNVINSCYEILEYWTKLGVDGFRFDVVNFFISDYNKLSSNDKSNMTDHSNTFDIIKLWKKKIKYINEDIIFVGEVGSEDLEILKKYQSQELMDYVFCFNISSIKEFNIEEMIDEINNALEVISKPTILFSSHDMPRFNHRLANYDYNKYLTILTLTLFTKQLSVLYQGDELFIKDYVPTNIDEMNDIQSINEYNILRKTHNEKESFEKSLKSCRDYSRKIIESEQFVLRKEVINIFNIYNKQLKNEDLVELSFDKMKNNIIYTYNTLQIIVSVDEFNIKVVERKDIHE